MAGNVGDNTHLTGIKPVKPKRVVARPRPTTPGVHPALAALAVHVAHAHGVAQGVSHATSTAAYPAQQYLGKPGGAPSGIASKPGFAAHTGRPGVKPKPGKPGVKPKPGKPGVVKPAPVDAIQSEINRQVAQDQGLTNYQNTYTAGLYDKTKADATALAAQYGIPATAAPTDPTNRWAQLYGNIGAATQAGNQNNALGSGQDMLANFTSQQANNTNRHQQYAQRLQGMIPGMRLQQQAAEASAAESQMRLQIGTDLHNKQFGLDVAKYNANNANNATKNRLDLAKIQAGQDSSNRTASTAAQKEMRSRADAYRAKFWTYTKSPDQTDNLGNKTAGARVWNAPPQQFRSAMSELQSIGYTPAQAAKIAASWSASSDNNKIDASGGGPITFRPGHELGVYKSMLGMGVSKKNALAITRQYYGNRSWRPIRHRPATPASVFNGAAAAIGLL